MHCILILLLLVQTTHHGILGVGLYASFYKIPHFGAVFQGLAYMRVYTACSDELIKSDRQWANQMMDDSSSWSQQICSNRYRSGFSHGHTRTGKIWIKTPRTFRSAVLCTAFILFFMRSKWSCFSSIFDLSLVTIRSLLSEAERILVDFPCSLLIGSQLSNVVCRARCLFASWTLNRRLPWMSRFLETVNELFQFLFITFASLRTFSVRVVSIASKADLSATSVFRNSNLARCLSLRIFQCRLILTFNHVNRFYALL